MTIKELCKNNINCAVCPYLPICGDIPENYSLGNDLEVTNAIIETAKELEQQPCEDAISREDALKALDYDIKSFEFKSGVSRHMNEIANLLNTIYEIQSDNIKALPPIKPTSRVGHWIYDDYNWRCSECNEAPKTLGYVGTADFMTEHFKFCNHCGAKMIEPQQRSGSL